MKRAISMLAAIAMIVSLFVVGVAAVTAAENSLAIHFASDGWDTSKLAEGQVSSTAGGDQRLMFNNMSNSYTLEVTISGSTPTSDWPCAGIIIGDDLNGNGLRLEIFSGWQGGGDQHWYKILDQGRNIIGQEIVLAGKSGIESENGVKVKIVRIGKELEIYLGGELVHAGFYDKLANSGVCGLLTVDSKTTFSDITYTPGVELAGTTSKALADTSGNCDISQAANNVITTTAGGMQYVFFDAPKDDHYVLDMVVKNVRATADWPSAAFLVSDDGVGGALRFELFTGWQGGGDEHWIKVMDSARNMIGTEIMLGGRSGIESENGARMTVVRDGRCVSFYLNGQRIYTGEHDQLNNPGSMAIYTMDSTATITDWSYTSLTEKAGDPAPAVGSATNGWDVSKIEFGTIKSTAGGVQDLLFNVEKTNAYTLEATVRLNTSTAGWPCAGLIVGDDGQGNGIRIEIFTGWQGSGAEHWFKILDKNRNVICGDIKFSPKSGLEAGEGAALKIVREGKKLEFYVNGQLMHTGEYDQLAADGVCGLLTVDSLSTFSNIVYTPGEPVVIEDPLKFNSATSELKAGWNTFNYYSNDVVMPFAIYIPEGYNTDKEYPVLMLLHGLGLVGKTPNDVINSNEGALIRRAVSEYKETIILVPVSAQGWIADQSEPRGDLDYVNGVTEYAWLKAADALYADVAAKLAVDADRQYLAGYSNGGQSAMYLLDKYPERFTAAVIMVATGDKEEAADLAKTPIWLFAGQNDGAMDYNAITALVDAVKAAGGEIKLTVGNTGHDASPQVNAEGKLIEWLYSFGAPEGEEPEKPAAPSLELKEGETTFVSNKLHIVRDGWDKTNIENGVIISTGGYQEVWFNLPAADKYMIKVTVSGMKALNNDWPSVGLIVGDNQTGTGVRMSLFTGWQGVGDQHWFKHYDLQFSEPPVVPDIMLTGRSGVESEEGVELCMIRDGKKFSVYIDGVLIYTAESDALADAGKAGFYANGATVTFSNWSYTGVAGTTNPDTSDMSQIGTAIAGMLTSLAAIGGAVVIRKRNK